MSIYKMIKYFASVEISLYSLREGHISLTPNYPDLVKSGYCPGNALHHFFIWAGHLRGWTKYSMYALHTEEKYGWPFKKKCK